MNRLVSVLVKIAYGFVGLVGGLLILYALALVLLGMEDVGGPKVALPVGAGLCVIGAGLIVVGLRGLDDEAG